MRFNPTGRASGRTLILRAALAAALLTAGVAAGGAGHIVGARADAAANRVETPVASSSPITSVLESEVSVYLPLPASAGAHPAACDWLSYLRYRAAAGPANSADADRVLVAQPGILEGAGAFDSVARNTVAAAAKLGKHIEFWALERRSNCLEDNTGIHAAEAVHNAQIAIDYYYHGASVDGRTFGGYLTNDQVGWLANVGIEQTVWDEYNLLAEELPSQQLRREKVLCGGHSLGGTITAFFAEWDFNGSPGYEQCGGYFALDTAISTSLASLNGMSGSSLVPSNGLDYTLTQAALQSGALTRTVSLPVLINPETMHLLDIAAVAAQADPGGVSAFAASLPSSTNINTTEGFLFSKDLGTFLTGSPSIKQFNVTNAAAFGALMDNNSQPLAFLQTSVGFFDGGTVVDKNFPAPNDLYSISALKGLTTLLGPDLKAIPATPNGPLYGWLNYNQVGTAADPGARSANGQLFTTAAQEVTDIGELARSFAEQPLDFTEAYFPTKLVTDIDQATDPQIASHLLYPQALTANPTINLIGGSGLVVASGVLPPHGTTVIAPGYHHLDVLTASPTQNNGAPEPVSTNLATFAVG